MSSVSNHSITQMFEGVNYASSLSPEVQYSGLVSDSREVEKGDVFACIAERASDREAHLKEALSRKAAAVILDSSLPLIDSEERVVVADLRRNLSQISGNVYGHPSKYMSLVGITGTNGKSTVCSWIEQLFEMSGQAAASIGTLGAHGCGRQLLKADGMTTRDAIKAQQVIALCKEAGANILAMEVSSHGMDQYRVESVFFTVALFTNFSRDHLDYHGTETDYWQAKKRLFDLPGIRCAVLNIDDEKGRELAQQLSGKMQLITFSAEGDERADIYITDLSYKDGFHATLKLGKQPVPSVNKRTGPSIDRYTELQLEGGQVQLHLPQMVAEFELSNLLAALAGSSALGLSLDLAAAKSGDLKAAEGRVQLAASVNESDVYVDYAHTPDAVSRVLAALRASKPSQLIAVLGCGGDRDLGKRPEMARAALSLADRLIITSDNPRSEDPAQITQDMLAGIDDLSQVDCIADRRQAISFAIEHAPRNSCIAILGKGHESIQIIGDKELPFNDVQVVQDLVEELILAGPDTKGGGL